MQTTDISENATQNIFLNAVAQIQVTKPDEGVTRCNSDIMVIMVLKRQHHT